MFLKDQNKSVGKKALNTTFYQDQRGINMFVTRKLQIRGGLLKILTLLLSIIKGLKDIKLCFERIIYKTNDSNVISTAQMLIKIVLCQQKTRRVPS